MDAQAEQLARLEEGLIAGGFQQLHSQVSETTPPSGRRLDDLEHRVTELSEGVSLGTSELSQFRQSLETQLGTALGDIRRRTDELQDTLEDSLNSRLGHIGRQLQGATGRIDRLGDQFQEGIARAESHQVHLDVLRVAFDKQDQRLQKLEVGMEHALSNSPWEKNAEALDTLFERVNTQATVLEELVSISSGKRTPSW